MMCHSYSSLQRYEAGILSSKNAVPNVAAYLNCPLGEFSSTVIRMAGPSAAFNTRSYNRFTFDTSRTVHIERFPRRSIQTLTFPRNKSSRQIRGLPTSWTQRPEIDSLLHLSESEGERKSCNKKPSSFAIESDHLPTHFSSALSTSGTSIRRTENDQLPFGQRHRRPNTTEQKYEGVFESIAIVL